MRGRSRQSDERETGADEAHDERRELAPSIVSTGPGYWAGFAFGAAAVLSVLALVSIRMP